MPINPQQTELLDLFDKTRSVIHTFVASRTDADQAQIGAADRWAARDVLAYSAFWMEYMVERMEFYRRGETPPSFVDFDALGQNAFEANQRRPWRDVVAYVEHSLDGLIAEVRQFSDEQLNTENVYGDHGGPLLGEVRANGFIVPLQEIEKFYTRTGDTARAADVIATLREVIGEPEKIIVDLISPQALRNQQDTARGPLVVDVRGPKEYAAGHVKGAVNIPAGELSKKLARIPSDQPVVTYCNMQHPGESRGERAAALLRDKGYQVQALAGGFPGWKDAGLPVEKI